MRTLLKISYLLIHFLRVFAGIWEPKNRILKKKEKWFLKNVVGTTTEKKGHFGFFETV